MRSVQSHDLDETCGRGDEWCSLVSIWPWYKVKVNNLANRGIRSNRVSTHWKSWKYQGKREQPILSRKSEESPQVGENRTFALTNKPIWWTSPPHWFPLHMVIWGHVAHRNDFYYFLGLDRLFVDVIHVVRIRFIFSVREIRSKTWGEPCQISEPSAP